MSSLLKLSTKVHLIMRKIEGKTFGTGKVCVYVAGTPFSSGHSKPDSIQALLWGIGYGTGMFSITPNTLTVMLFISTSGVNVKAILVSTPLLRTQIFSVLGQPSISSVNIVPLVSIFSHDRNILPFPAVAKAATVTHT